MDLLPIIRSGIDALPEGPYTRGLRAVVSHIEVAIRHLQTGQESGDVQLFTDAIYRCNQAFEGSLKELYRVLSSKDPGKTTPAGIEKFLEKGGTLRSRVLNQLTRYRQEWRNPSTHDYMLDFDEDEAFLAIVNCSAFAKMAVAQVSSKLAFEHAKEEAPEVTPHVSAKKLELSEEVAVFAGVYLQNSSEMAKAEPARRTESYVSSLVGGFLSSLEGVEITMEAAVGTGKNQFADIVVSRGKERCLVELKAEGAARSSPTRAVEQFDSLMEAGSFSQGLMVVYAEDQPEYGVYLLEEKDHKGRYSVMPQRLAPDFDQRGRGWLIKNTVANLGME